MTYAHQGVELRQLPGMAPPRAPSITTASFKGADEPHPVLLTRKGTDILVRIERMLDEANQALAAQSSSPPGSVGAIDSGKSTPNTIATAADRESSTLPRGD